MKECNRQSGVVCKPYKYRQHGTILSRVEGTRDENKGSI
jgi:hypothetical protein